MMIGRQTMLAARTSWRSALALQRSHYATQASLAHQMVQQRLQGTVSLAPDAKNVSNTHVMFVPTQQKEQLKLPFAVSPQALRDFHAKPQERMYLYPSADADEQGRLLVVGLGDEAKVDETLLRKATHAALSATKAKRAKDVLLQVPELGENNTKLTPERVVEVMTQASMLSNYQFDKYLSSDHDENGEEKLKLPLKTIYLNAGAAFDEHVQEQVTVAEETIFARNLGNERANIVTPAFMEEVACATADELPHLSVKVLQQEDLKKEGMEMFLSVGQAATVAPRLVILEYRGNPDSDEKIALVGKGITFDTGGLNLKPTGFIEDMHTDMCGSAAVLGAIRAAARTGLKCNIVCALGLAENAIGSKATKPHTIMKSHKGITVENNNTDAEGRLVLGDTLSYIQKEYKTKIVIDVATLTGACIVALGEYCAGLFTNSDQLASQLQTAGTECYERCWRLPILPEHTDELKGFQCDSRSTGKGRYGGACTAAAFLQKFIDNDVEWAHLDIAGPSNYSSAKDYFPKGATGYGVQLLYTYLKTHHHNAKP